MNKILTYIISLTIIFLSIYFIIKPDMSFSEQENRPLQTNPEFSFKSLINTEYIERIEDYFNDQFPFRNTFMKIRTMVYKGMNIKDIDGVYFGEDDYLLEKHNKPKNNDKIIKAINRFSNNSNANVSLMLIPNAISIYNDKLPKNAITFNQLDTINYIYDNVDLNEINIYDTYIANKDKYQLYYKTDHHYTLYGAYLAYVEYCKNNNLNYKELNQYNIETISKQFTGSLASRVTDYKNVYDPIEIINKDININVYYEDTNTTTNSLYNFDYLDKKDKYAMFLDNNHPLIIINRKDINNNSKLIVIKDSYANSMIPFLVDNYSEIHVIDPRYYRRSISNYMKENQINNALILYNLNTLDTEGGLIGIK